MLNSLSEAEVVLGNIPSSQLIGSLPHLKFWQLDSAGFDQYQNINLTAPVANMGSFYAQRCAETIVSGLLAFYRGIHKLVRLQTEGTWVGAKIRPQLQAVAGKHVMILGAGAIALAVKEMLSGFGCNLTLVARKSAAAQLHTFDEVLSVLPETDAVINTLPGSAGNYVNAQFINAMKPGSVYANVGRGNTTDELALIDALENRKIAGAVLDVTAIEPLPANHKLWGMEQVILTQHSAGGDQNEVDGKVGHFIKNVNRFLNNEQPEDLINLSRGY